MKKTTEQATKGCLSADEVILDQFMKETDYLIDSAVLKETSRCDLLIILKEARIILNNIHNQLRINADNH